MIKSQILLLALCTVVGANFYFPPSKCAMGYSLALDYGTVSVAFHNGTFIDVAKIEGSPAYKHFMRSSANIGNASAQDGRPINTARPTIEVGDSVQLSNCRDLFPLESQWEKELQGRHNAEVLGDMLYVLRRSAQIAIDRGENMLHEAPITTPYPMSDAFVEALSAAIPYAGMRARTLRSSPAGAIAAMTAYEVGDRHVRSGDASSRQEQQVILSLDYSRAALTSTILMETDRMFETTHIRHDTLLGSETLAKESPKRRYDRLVRAFSDLEHIVPENAQIDTIVLLGESARDSALNEAFNEVFHPFSRIETSRITNGRVLSAIDPTFTAARGVALRELERQEFEEEDEAWRNTMELQEKLRSPEFQGKTIYVNWLGGPSEDSPDELPMAQLYVM